jgi:bifunctional enzyme CysN/CysC
VSDDRRLVSPDVVWEATNIPRPLREQRAGHLAAVIWLTGMSGAGKTTIARAVERELFQQGGRTMMLDGDQLRHGLCGDLSFTPEHRRENIRRAGEVARLFFDSGAIVLCAFVSPYRADRDRVRGLVPAGRFLEVHVTADLETLAARDPKGLYRRAAAGTVAQLTGVSAPYEAPLAADVVINTTRSAVEDSVAQLMDAIVARGLFATVVRR